MEGPGPPCLRCLGLDDFEFLGGAMPCSRGAPRRRASGALQPKPLPLRAAGPAARAAGRRGGAGRPGGPATRI